MSELLVLTRKILFVDDDPLFLDAMRRQFRKRMEITTAIGGAAGLEVLSKEGPFAAVVSDFTMPQMTGVEFLQRAAKVQPDAVRVMLTGNADLEVAVSALHEGRIFRFLLKPCPREALESTLNDCLEQYRLVMAERILTEELNQANFDLQELNENLEKRVQERTATIAGLYEYVAQLNGADGVEAVAELAVSTAARQLRAQRAWLEMAEGEAGALRIMASTGNPAESSNGDRPDSHDVGGRIFMAADLCNDEAQAAEVSDSSESEEIGSRIAMALKSAGHCVGVLNLADRVDGAPFSRDDMVCVQTIAEATAVALLNQQRLQERNEARDAIIMALAKLAEHRDPETGAHLERVQQYCRLLSEALSRLPRYTATINREFIETIVRSSPLHDIGKVGIPDRILLKPGKLTAEEYEIMKTHAQIGGDTIRSLVEQGRTQTFLRMGMDIAYYHHEKFDGTGYPFKLAGQDIPLEARIMALADVYDALTSRRVYKPAMPHEKAAAIIRKDCGTHFDPDIVAAFETREDDFRRLAAELADNPETSSIQKAPDAQIAQETSV